MATAVSGAVNRVPLSLHGSSSGASVPSIAFFGTSLKKANPVTNHGRMSTGGFRVMAADLDETKQTNYEYISQGLKEPMKGSVSHELEAGLLASDVWAVYGTLRLPELLTKLLPNVVPDIKVEEGNGGVGTILYVTRSPAAPGPRFQREKFIKIDNEQRVKEVELIEGGDLDQGFVRCFYRFEIVEISSTTSLIRSTFKYEIRDEDVSTVTPLVTIKPWDIVAEAIVGYLTEEKAGSISSAK